MLVDSNVLIDVIEHDPQWHDWSFAQMEQASVSDKILINSIVVAEVAPRFGTIEAFLDVLAIMLVKVEPLTADAAFRGGMAFQRYRQTRRPDQAKSLLADFLIGGHALALGATILTRDPRFYRSYFPDVPLITPERDYP